MRFAIVSPASIIKPEYVDGAVSTLQSLGHQVRVMPHVFGRHGSFAGTPDERSADLREALLSPDVDAIVCSRGGYGAVHLLPDLEEIAPRIAQHPKWIVGFSDITALHAFMHAHGLPSLHASMAKQLALGPDDPLNRLTLDILQNPSREVVYSEPTSPLSRRGACEGTLVGGNVAVFSALFGTPYDYLGNTPDPVLFIEDVAEPIYKIERILWQMRLSGHLQRLRGLIVGQFTEYKPSADHPDMYRMISRMVAPYDFPVAFDFPVGHVERNLPLIVGAKAHLTVGQATTRLAMRL